MNLIPWRGKRPDEEREIMPRGSSLSTLRTEMDRLFDRFFTGFWSEPSSAMAAFGFTPSLEVAETDREVLVRAELPGVDSKDVNITISGQLLTVTGEKKETVERREESFYHSERSFGTFRRTVQMPTPVDAEHVSAEFKNGVLQIKMAKQPGAQPKRIPVRVDGSEKAIAGPAGGKSQSR